MANSTPPNGGAPPVSAQYAGYAHFYATPQQQHQQPQQQQQWSVAPPRPPPRGPGMYGRPPPPGPGGAYPGIRPPAPRGGPRPMPNSGAPWARGLPPPRPGVPRPMTAPPPNAANQWQWGTSSNAHATVVASTPPVRFNMNARTVPPPRPAPLSAFTPAPRSAPLTTGVSSGGKAASVNNTKWPDSLHDYVKRTFARCKGAADQSLTQNALKETITNAIMTNTLWTKNWAVEPLPTLVGDTVTAKPNVVNAPHGPMPMMPARGPPMPHFRPPRSPAGMFQGGGVPGSFVPFNPPTKAHKRKHEHQVKEKKEDMQRKNQRRQRFQNDPFENAKYVTQEVNLKDLRVLNDEGELDLEAMTIKGTCQTIEKEYLRLTSPPLPSTVRPEPVLKKALEMVRKKWKASDCDYIYACSQLKSIRQDCTVQRIKNEFTVLVYETHARVALESGDINEFNQCQTQLHELYEKSIPGEVIEFLSYRILYCIYVSLQAKKPDSNAGQLGMYSVLASVTASLRQHESIIHALAVREAVSMNNYHRFFKLYAEAPKMAGYLMDPIVPTIRLRALRTMCKAYRPNIPIDYVRHELKLKGKEGNEFIQQSGIVFVSGSDDTLVDAKNSDIVWVLSDQSSLI